jgi:hypothetical protein
MGAEYLLVTRRLPAKKFFQLRETSVTLPLQLLSWLSPLPLVDYIIHSNGVHHGTGNVGWYGCRCHHRVRYRICLWKAHSTDVLSIMIEIHCGSCDRHLVLKFVIRDAGVFVERVEGHSECLCSYTGDDLMDILEDSYRHECPEEIPKVTPWRPWCRDGGAIVTMCRDHLTCPH